MKVSDVQIFSRINVRSRLCHIFLATSLLLFLINVQGAAQANATQFASATSLSYNSCTGNAELTFPVRNNDGSNFAHVLRWIEVRSLLPGESAPTQGQVKFRMTAEYPIYVIGSNCNSGVSNPLITPYGPGNDLRNYNVCEGSASEHQETSNTYEVLPGTGAERFIKVTIRDLRNEFFGSAIKFQLSGVYDYECCWGPYSNTLFPPSNVSYTFDFPISWNNGLASPTVTAPTLTVQSGACQSNMLDWNNISPPDNCPGTISYQVFRDNNPTPIATVSSSEYHDMNLVAGQSHSYQVRALWSLQGSSRVASSAASNVATITVAPSNGEIHGKVVALDNACVEGITIKATLTNPSLLTACPNLTAPSSGYTTTTASDGTYHFYNIFYGGPNDPDANYKVEGTLDTHRISSQFNVLLNDAPGGNIKNNIDLMDSTIALNPGSIHLTTANNSIIPQGTDPGTISSTTGALGSPSPLTYSWEMCTGNCSNENNWNPAPGSTNSSTYDLPVLNETTRFRRKITNACGKYAVSNFIEIETIAANGVIEGTVKSPAGAGGPGAPIAGVTVTVVRTTAVSGGGLVTNTYSDVTDNDGVYSISNIYYGDMSADFSVTPTFNDGQQDHEFDPESRTVTLMTTPNIRSNIDFTDLTSYSVSGNIYQDFNSTICGMDSVGIMLNGILVDSTDFEGNYNIAIPGAGTYTIVPVFQDHTFVADFDNTDLFINSNLTDLNFENTTTHVISGFVGGGCDSYLGQAQITFMSSDLCITYNAITDIGTGNYTVELPARKYRAQVTNFDNPDPYNELEVLAFFQGTTEINLTLTDTMMDFVYRPEPSIEVLGLPTETCGRIIMEQIQKVPLMIKVWEGPMSLGCPLDTGYVLIYDDIGDAGNTPIQIPVSNGEALYTIMPGEPNITAPYLKNLTIVAKDLTGQSDTWTLDALVTGAKARNSTFTTVTPEIPLMILRDPPGDESYSYLESNESMELATSFFHKESGSLNVWGKAKFGTKFEVGLGITTEVKAWGQIGASLEVGGSQTTTEESIMSISTTERFQTSGNQDITGTEGDVFIGAAMNLVYANSDVIDFDPNTCTVVSDVKLIIAPDGFATQYMYTEQHIREVIIPELEQLSSNHPNPDSMAFFANQANVWNQALQRNETLKADAVPSVPFQGNKTFSNNVHYEQSTTATTSQKISVEFDVAIEAQLAIEAGVEIAGNGFSAGFTAKFRADFGESESTTTTSALTTGFYLFDDDQGDSYTVDILTDPVYKTPVFRLVSARTSCPYEEGTLQIDVPKLSVNTPVQTDVDPGAEAEFMLTLGNESESESTRSYFLALNQQTNPDGAMVKIGGSPYTQPLGPFTIGFGQTVNQTVKVGLGAQGIYSYEGLEFILYPACDPGLGETVKISAFFDSPCSDISLFEPNPNWILNENSNVLNVHIKDYDKNLMSPMDQIKIQYAPTGSTNWLNAQVLSPSDLNDNIPGGSNLGDITPINLTNLPDGAYDIRLALVCGLATVYSSRASGKIDRTAPRLVGIPSPNDYVFVQGMDELSALFDEVLHCTGAEVSLINATSNSTHSAQLFCFQNKIIITPDANLPDGQYEVILTGIEDMYGNESEEVMWSFQVGEFEDDCGPLNITINNVTLDGIRSGVYYGTTIQSANMVELMGDVTMHATTSVSLNPGFSVPQNAVFISELGDCDEAPNEEAPCHTATEVLSGNIYNGNTAQGSIVGSGVACGPGDLNSPGVWYRVTGTDAIVTAYFCGSPGFNAVIEVFSGTCGQDLTCVTNNEMANTVNGCSVPAGKIVFHGDLDVDYYILVRGTSPSETGEFSLIVDDCDMLLEGEFCSRIYVDDSANGANDGSSWENAFINLQDALEAAQADDQIWVAKGKYYTDQGTTVTEGDRLASFVMKNEVAIIGGFAGYETPDYDLNTRDLITNETILSGDIGLKGDRSDNSYHVIFNDNNGLDASSIIDGVTIVGGNANGAGAHLNGGGMYNVQSSPLVKNCIIKGNYGSVGGGIYNSVSTELLILNCVFMGNEATGGGGVALGGGRTVINHCSFSGNQALYPDPNGSSNGNAVRIFSNSFSSAIANSIFWGNGTADTPDEILGSGNFPVSNCIVEQPFGTTYPGTGNINEDPLFISQPSLLGTSGNLRLQSGSPAIDKVDAVNVPYDHDGVLRPVGVKADIGAFEFNAVNN